MPEAAREPTSARPLLLVAAVKAATSAGVLWGGFRAISDDDYARVVIAQRFAEAPSWDPSGTSWLPFPFWLNGGAMLLFGPSLSTARAVAIASGIGAALLLYLASRWWGASRGEALAGALVACSVPYFARLGVATVPEALSAACIVLGATSLARSSAAERLGGAVAITAATLSRYEAWPVAVVFSVYCAWDARRQRRPGYLAAAGLSVLGPAAWVVHGAAHHGSAFFFLHRVAQYRRALGAGSRAWLEQLTDYPVALVTQEPELAAAVIVTLLTAASLVKRLAWRRPVVVLAGLLAFLIVGQLGDGAPTHHGERALLPLWLLAALFVGVGLCRSWVARAPRARGRSALATLALVSAVAIVVRPRVSTESFAERSAELDVGRRARELTQPGQRWVVDTDDFGYFAVMAAFADPSAMAPLDERHPGRVATKLDDVALHELLRGRGVDWLIRPVARAEAALTRYQNTKLAVTRLGPPPP